MPAGRSTRVPVRALAAALVGILTLASSPAAGPARAQGPATPPYLAYGSSNLIVGFEVDPAAVRDLLPAGLEPAGRTAYLNMYAVPAALGVPAYDRSYVWVDVVGHDAWDGTKGRYVLVGWAEPAGFREVATGALSWPAEPGRTHLSVEDGWVRAELAVDGRPALCARARREAPSAEAEVATAMLPYVFVAPGAKGRAATAADVGVNRVAFAGRLRPLRDAAVEVHEGAPEALRRLRPTRIVSAVEVEDSAFVLGVVTPPPAAAGGRRD